VAAALSVKVDSGDSVDKWYTTSFIDARGGGGGWCMGSLLSTVMTGLWLAHVADKVRGRGKVGGAGWGTVLVRALIVGTPLVRGALAS
jgi:hypothetical protein